MSLVTLRPNSTVIAGGENDGFVPAPTRHQALADDTDNSWVFLDTAGEVCRLGLPDPAIPADALVKSVTVRSRDGLAAFGSGIQSQVAFELIDADADPDDSLGFQTSVIVWGPTTHNVFTAQIPESFSDLEIAMVLAAYTPSGPYVQATIYELFVDVLYVTKPATEVVTPAGTVDETNVPTVTWFNTLDAEGGVQTKSEVKIFTQAEYEAGGFDPATSESQNESGVRTGQTTSWQSEDQLDNATYRAYVRVAQTLSGTDFWSDWEYSEFEVDVPRPGDPSPLAITAQDEAGRIRVGVEPGEGDVTTDVLQLQHSFDGGETWENVRTPLGEGLLATRTPSLFEYLLALRMNAYWRFGDPGGLGVVTDSQQTNVLREDFTVFDGVGAPVTLDASVETDLTGWQAGCTPGTLDIFERTNEWSSDGDYSIHFKATAGADGAHADLGFQFGRVVPGAAYTILFDINVIQKPAAGQAAFLVWLDEDLNPIYPELRGDVVTELGEQTLSMVGIAPSNAVVAWCFVANGGGGAGALFNLMLNGEVSDYYADNPRLYVNHPAALFGSPTLGIPGGVAGDPDTAIALNGTTDFVKSNYSPFVDGGELGIGGLFWGDDPDAAFMAWGSATGGDGQVGFQIFGSSFGFGADGLVQFYKNGPGTPSAEWPGAWPGEDQYVYLHVDVDDDANTAELFVNGVSAGEVVMAAGSYPTESPGLLIGAYGVGSLMDGNVDEFYVREHKFGPLVVENINALISDPGSSDVVLAEVHDYEAPNGRHVLYRARARHTFESGAYSVSGWTEASGIWESRVFWLKHPTRPELNKAITLGTPAKDGVARAGRGGSFQPFGAEEAVAISTEPGAESGAIRVLAENQAEKDALDALFRAKVPLLLQVRAGDQEPDRWLALGDWTRQRIVDTAGVPVVWDEVAWTRVARPEGNLIE